MSWKLRFRFDDCRFVTALFVCSTMIEIDEDVLEASPVVAQRLAQKEETQRLAAKKEEPPPIKIAEPPKKMRRAGAQRTSDVEFKRFALNRNVDEQLPSDLNPRVGFQSLGIEFAEIADTCGDFVEGLQACFNRMDRAAAANAVPGESFLADWLCACPMEWNFNEMVFSYGCAPCCNLYLLDAKEEAKQLSPYAALAVQTPLEVGEFIKFLNKDVLFIL